MFANATPRTCHRAEKDLMPSIRIPESAFPAIRHLLGLRPEEFDAFADALGKAKPSIGPDKFWRRVAKAVPQIEESVVKSIVNELFAIDYIRDALDGDNEQFSQQLSDAVFSSASDSFSITEDERDLFQRRINKIFEFRKSLSITAKALKVLTDHEHIFYSCKIMTDFRPVFNDAGDAIEAAVILHNLRIHYGEGDDHKDFFVALDTSDIEALRDVLDRADEKARALRSLIQKAEVPYLDADE
jgi:hypothetical protein